MAAQFSVACGLPLSVLLLKGLPTRPGSPDTDALVPLYAIVMLVFGLLISWCALSLQDYIADTFCLFSEMPDSFSVHVTDIGYVGGG